MTFSELLVLGAGPAGCTAAIHARQQGRTVTLVEKNSSAVPGPGETFHPGIEKIFEKLGIAEDVAAQSSDRHTGIWREEGSTRQFLQYSECESESWYGYQINRRDFQQILIERVRKFGVDVFLGEVPKRVLYRGKYVRGIETTTGKKYYADWTLDATGRRGWLANQLDLKAVVQSEPKSGSFGWVESTPAFGSSPVLKKRDDGWDWHAPLGSGQTAWVKLRNTDKNKFDFTWYLTERSGGSGYLLLGDAAGTLDPSSSKGVLRAMMSGMMSAHLIGFAQDKKLTRRNVVDLYTQWFTEFYKHESSRLDEENANSHLSDSKAHPLSTISQQEED